MTKQWRGESFTSLLQIPRAPPPAETHKMADEPATSEPFSGTDPILDDEGEAEVRWLLQPGLCYVLMRLSIFLTPLLCY